MSADDSRPVCAYCGQLGGMGDRFLYLTLGTWHHQGCGATMPDPLAALHGDATAPRVRYDAYGRREPPIPDLSDTTSEPSTVGAVEGPGASPVGDLSPTPQQTPAVGTSSAAVLGGGVGDPSCVTCGGSGLTAGGPCLACDRPWTWDGVAWHPPSPDPAAAAAASQARAGSGDPWDAALAGAELEQLQGRLRALAEAVDVPDPIPGRVVAGLIRMAVGGGE